jgi:AbrB family transcriptional regulator, transcriptional pleiotropic regulator of transition state genes
MKSTGIVRKVDQLGRVVVPIEVRNTMGLKIGDPLEIFVEGDLIYLKKYDPACVFCGNARNVFTFNGKLVCRGCAGELRKAAE